MSLILPNDTPKDVQIILPKKSHDAPLEPGTTYLEKGLRLMIDEKFERSDLFQVFSEKNINRGYEDESIYNQMKGKSAEIAEVKFNGEWLCDINENTNPDMAYLQILNGLNALKNKLERRFHG